MAHINIKRTERNTSQENKWKRKYLEVKWEVQSHLGVGLLDLARKRRTQHFVPETRVAWYKMEFIYLKYFSEVYLFAGLLCCSSGGGTFCNSISCSIPVAKVRHQSSEFLIFPDHGYVDLDYPTCWNI